ncbi:MAG: HEAT repeat domain-containing protein [Acidobacteria bacterium]|nr:HEAT repeat domain-containing protein [Acidobacteriota bacterium]
MRQFSAHAIAPFVLLLLGCQATEAEQRSTANRVEAVDEGSLAARIGEAARSASGAVWITYEVPVNDTKAFLCCFDSFDVARKNGWRNAGCTLEESSSFISSDGSGEWSAPAVERTDVVIHLRAENGLIREARSFSKGCRIDAGGVAIERLGPADPEESVRFLSRLVDQIDAGRPCRARSNDEEAQSVITAIAMHRAKNMIAALTSIVTSDRDEEIRGHAAFWLGAKGGSEGREVLTRLIDSAISSELREEAIAGIAQDESDAAAELLLQLARGHEVASVREHALFWLAEKAGEKAASELEQATDDPDEDVREMAVFSISRLPPDKSVPMLIDLAKSHKSSGVREQSLFWLGQSGDPRALDFIEEILMR